MTKKRETKKEAEGREYMEAEQDQRRDDWVVGEFGDRERARDASLNQ